MWPSLQGFLVLLLYCPQWARTQAQARTAVMSDGPAAWLRCSYATQAGDNETAPKNVLTFNFVVFTQTNYISPSESHES